MHRELVWVCVELREPDSIGRAGGSCCEVAEPSHRILRDTSGHFGKPFSSLYGHVLKGSWDLVSKVISRL